MSATLDAGPVAAFLGVPCRRRAGAHTPLTIGYAAAMPLGPAVGGLLLRTPGNVLCFLPGAPEFGGLPEVRAVAPGTDVVELHGSLDANAQDAALEGLRRPARILKPKSETSLTVPASPPSSIPASRNCRAMTSSAASTI